MAQKKSEFYSSLWVSCDELRGGMNASHYKGYVLVPLFMKHISHKCSGQPVAPIMMRSLAIATSIVILALSCLVTSTAMATESHKAKPAATKAPVRSASQTQQKNSKSIMLQCDGELEDYLVSNLAKSDVSKYQFSFIYNLDFEKMTYLFENTKTQMGSSGTFTSSDRYYALSPDLKNGGDMIIDYSNIFIYRENGKIVLKSLWHSRETNIFMNSSGMGACRKITATPKF